MLIWLRLWDDLQDPQSLQCYSGIAAMGSLPPSTWVLGDAFMHLYYTVFDFGKAAVPTGSPETFLVNAGGQGSSSGPRVGIGALTPAEKAAASELYQQGLASKSSDDWAVANATGSLLRLMAASVAFVLLVGTVGL